MLIKKINQAAAAKDLPMDIAAQGTNLSNLKELIPSLDAILLAPQVRYFEEEIKGLIGEGKTKVVNIDMTTYGRMDGAKIVEDLEKVCAP